MKGTGKKWQSEEKIIVNVEEKSEPSKNKETRPRMPKGSPGG